MKIGLKDLAKIRADHSNQKIVFLGGTFDLLHVGHLAYLQMAKQFGDIVIVGINSDERTKRVKGDSRPIIGQSKRAQMIDNIKGVDYVFVMPKGSTNGLRPSFKVIKLLRPNIYLVPQKGWLKGQGFCSQYGTKIVLAKRIDKGSTSRIIKRIKATA